MKGDDPPSAEDLAPPPPPKRSLTGNFDQVAQDGQPPKPPSAFGQPAAAVHNAYRNASRVRPIYPSAVNLSKKESVGMTAPGLLPQQQGNNPPVQMFIPAAGTMTEVSDKQTEPSYQNIQKSVDVALKESIGGLQALGNIREVQEGADVFNEMAEHPHQEDKVVTQEKSDAFGEDAVASFDQFPEDDESFLETMSGYQTPHSTSSFMNYRSPDSKNAPVSDFMPPRTFAEALAINQDYSDVEAEFGSDTEPDNVLDASSRHQNALEEVNLAQNQADKTVPCPPIDENVGWYYRDLHLMVQGPFLLTDLHGWKEYLPQDLKVWQTVEEEFWELHLLLGASNSVQRLDPVAASVEKEELRIKTPEEEFLQEVVDKGLREEEIHQGIHVIHEEAPVKIKEDQAERSPCEPFQEEVAVKPGPQSLEGESAALDLASIEGNADVPSLLKENEELRFELEKLSRELENLRSANHSQLQDQKPCTDNHSNGKDKVENTLAESQIDMQNQMSDLLVCLGQEGAKIERLKSLLLEKGMLEEEVDKALEAVEEEYGFGEMDDKLTEDERILSNLQEPAHQVPLTGVAV